MTIEIQNYTRKPFDVEAIQVTDENMAEVSKWCKGKLKENDQGAPFILVKVHAAATDRHKQAFKGDWIFYSRSTGYKVYSDRAFNGSFDKKVVYTDADAKGQLGEALEEEQNDTKPEISVAKVLVDEHNAALAAQPAKGVDVPEINRDAGTGQFVTEEYADANPETTVTESITLKEGELSPEDQARLIP